MKRSILRHKYALWLVAALTLASCSQDEFADDNRLPEGKYPVVIQATGLQAVATPASRATVDGDWLNVKTTVAVKVDGIGVREYSATSSDTDGYKTATLKSSNPFYWQSTESITVSAWWPYDATNPNVMPDVVVAADQSTLAGFTGSDFISAEAQPVQFDNPTLTFSHRTAKVSVQLIAEDGVTFDEKTSVQLLNVSYVKDDDENDVTTINTYQPDDAAYTYLALLAPQTISGGSRFIQVSVGGDNFYYTPTDDKPLAAGTAYTYTITVKADGSGIEVKEVKDEQWADGGEATVASKNVFVRYTAADVKKGDYIYTDGTTSDGGLRMIYTDGSMVSLSGADKPQPVAGKTVAGIVFWTPSETTTEGRISPASLTDDKIMAAEHPDCTRGLAVSLKEVSSSTTWQFPFENVANFQSSDDFTHDKKSDFVPIASNLDIATARDYFNFILGYQNTQVLLAYNTHCRNNGKTDYIVPSVAALAEFGQNTNPAPTGSTGWFFPSVKELHILCYKDVDYVYTSRGTQTWNIVSASLSAAGGDNLESTRYWSSTERSGMEAFAFYVDFSDGGGLTSYTKITNYRVRAVCAF